MRGWKLNVVDKNSMTLTCTIGENVVATPCGFNLRQMFTLFMGSRACLCELKAVSSIGTRTKHMDPIESKASFVLLFLFLS